MIQCCDSPDLVKPHFFLSGKLWGSIPDGCRAFRNLEKLQLGPDQWQCQWFCNTVLVLATATKDPSWFCQQHHFMELRWLAHIVINCCWSFVQCLESHAFWDHWHLVSSHHMVTYVAAFSTFFIFKSWHENSLAVWSPDNWALMLTVRCSLVTCFYR